MFFNYYFFNYINIHTQQHINLFFYYNLFNFFKTMYGCRFYIFGGKTIKEEDTNVTNLNSIAKL